MENLLAVAARCVLERGEFVTGLEGHNGNDDVTTRVDDRQPRVGRYLPVGTRRLSSSNQFCTKRIVVMASRLRCTKRTMRNL